MRIIIVFGKIIFFCYTLLLLFYYALGIYFSYLDNDFDFLQIVWGILMVVLIYINIKFIRREYDRWRNR